MLHSFGDAVSGIESEYPLALLIAGCTTLFLLFFNGLIKPIAENLFADKALSKEIVHVNSLWSALLVHGCFEGLSVGALTGSSRWVVLGVMFVHKIVEYSALTAQMVLANMKARSVIFWATLLTAEIPCLICFIVAWQTIYSEANASETPLIPMHALFAALCGGTFLYLSLCHLIPEALEDNHEHTYSHEDEPELNGLPLADEKQPSIVTTSSPKGPTSIAKLMSVYTAIGLGWTVFALFALTPGHSHDEAAGGHHD
jgi:ZIP Zinc transporter